MVHGNGRIQVADIVKSRETNCTQPRHRQSWNDLGYGTGAITGSLGKIGPVEIIQLQSEMRRRALLEQWKDNAWAGSFTVQHGPGPGLGGDV